MYIVRKINVSAKNLYPANGRTDKALMKDYIKKLRTEGAQFVFGANDSVVVRQFLSCYMSSGAGIVSADFSDNPAQALDMDEDIARQLIAHKGVVGGTIGWRMVKSIV